MVKLFTPKMQKHLSQPVKINFNIPALDVNAFRAIQDQIVRVSSGSTIDHKPRIPVHIVQEYVEYKKLIELYKERFEKWPDAEMREILFKQAIKFVVEA